MRIAMFSNFYTPLLGGVSVSVETFRRELTRLGHVAGVFAPSVDGPAKEIGQDEPFVFRLRAIDLSKPFNVALPLALKREVMPILRGFKPEVIHSHHPYLIGDLAAKCARDLGCPLIFTCHTTYMEHASMYVRGAPRLAAQVMSDVIQNYLERCRRVIAPTPTIRDQIEAGFRLSCPIAVLPTPVDLEPPPVASRNATRVELGLSGAQALVYVGRLAREKSMDVMLAAFARVRARIPKARLVVIGGGPGRDRLMRGLEAEGLKPFVTVTGQLPREEVARYLVAGDVFVITSKTETQGLAIVEAMAAGLPVVAVAAGGTLDVVTPDCGLLMPPDDPLAFAEAVVRLLQDDALRRSMGRAGRERWHAYRPPLLAQRLVELYESILRQEAPVGLGG